MTSNIRQYLTDHPWLAIDDFNLIVPNLITLALVIAGVVLAFMLITAGIQWISSGGDKEALAAAQKKLTTALIGAVILFSTWVIMNIVRGFFGLETIRGGGGSSGQFDCCSIVGGQMNNKTACCQLADSHHCVSNRYQSSSATCNQLKIDWNCWSKKFGGGQNPDPNGYCQSGN